jgi:hypothetical protein
LDTTLGSCSSFGSVNISIIVGTSFLKAFFNLLSIFELFEIL